jgi:hypothetical protein
MIVLDTPEGIDFARLCALKGALKLEIMGMKKRGRSVYSILRSMGYRGSRESVLAQLEEQVSKMTREESEAKMIKTPNDWPRWPVLPLKRNREKAEFETAVLFEDKYHAAGTPRVYLSNMYAKVEESTKYIDYASVDALLNDGWRID